MITIWKDGEVYSVQVTEGREGFVKRFSERGLEKIGLEKGQFKSDPEALGSPYNNPIFKQALKMTYKRFF